MKRLALFWLIINALSLSAQEYISSFNADITVNKDGSVLVTETIDIHTEGRIFRHGLLRELPLSYHDRLGNHFIVRFSLNQILMNGASAPFHQESWRNGKRIYIGSSQRLLLPGNYRFQLTYTMQRVLGFFEKHDELYWNVTGNGWRIPILSATATVTLPEGIDQSDIKATAYTGLFGAQDTNFTQSITNNSIQFATTQPLRPGEGITIVAGWPKGVVTIPSLSQKITWFFQDNGFLLLLIGLLLSLFSFLWWTNRKIKAVRASHTIIPLFHPPETIDPALMRSIYLRKYDTTGFAAQLVQYAVQGYIAIKQAKNWWKENYVLEVKKPNASIPLIQNLFKNKRESLVLRQSNRATIEPAMRSFEETIKNQSERYYFTERGYLEVSLFLGLLCFLVSLLSGTLIAILTFITLAVSFSMGVRLFINYTPLGWEMLHKIKGFKLYMETAETERLKIIGTPPTKTPELWEKYLPYAIALNVEKQWSEKFAPVFKQLEVEGHPYQPIWFIGRPFSPGWYNSFGNQLSSSLASSISSSAYAPGSRSGFGGGGSSGGGAGGGGGGGW